MTRIATTDTILKMLNADVVTISCTTARFAWSTTIGTAELITKKTGFVPATKPRPSCECQTLT